jgi:tetratricopeptide (TPR) repeat protein
VWQQYLDEHPNSGAFEFLSVAVDTDPERVRPFAEPYTYLTVVDTASVLGRLFDFDVVPNGLIIDEEGIVRFLHVGGFYLGRPEIRQQVDAILAADFSRGESPAFVLQESLELEIIRGELAHNPGDADLLMALGDALLREDRVDEAIGAFQGAAEVRPDDWSTAFALGTGLRRKGDVEGAVRSWRRALELDPHNFTVRKQIWREEHPERFYPTIDPDWQREQLKIERYTPPGR